MGAGTWYFYFPPVFSIYVTGSLTSTGIEALLAMTLSLSDGRSPSDHNTTCFSINSALLRTKRIHYIFHLSLSHLGGSNRVLHSPGRKVPMKTNHLNAAAAAKSLQLCSTLCDPIDDSPPGSPIPGILQARTLEWVAISFSNAGK